MKLDYEAGSLRVENGSGLRWQLKGAAKPKFSFGYDALSVSEQSAVRRDGNSVYPLVATEVAEVKEFVDSLSPPAGVSMQRQVIADLRAFAYGLINSVTARLEYDGLLDVMITAREGSADLYAEEARRVLAYVDAIWNAYYGLEKQILNTPEAQLKPMKKYAEMMPFPPPIEHFSDVVPEELFRCQGP